jgi:flagellar hook protein FlgE
MMRSLYSGVSGLKTHQTRMDVIGNNIANVNTVAYKASTMSFQDLMYQTTSSASGADATTGRGGVNATQIGLGVTTGAISNSITTQGAAQTTNDAFDLRIEGNSFFVVNNGTENYYTRAGAFYVDGVGNLAMKTTGYNVMGWAADENGNLSNELTALKIMSAENQVSSPEATELARITGILDKNGSKLNNGGQSISLQIYDDLGYSYTCNYNIKPVTDANGNAVDGKYTIELEKMVDSNGETLGAANYLKQYNADGTLPAEYDPSNNAFKAEEIAFGNTIVGKQEYSITTSITNTGTSSETTTYVVKNYDGTTKNFSVKDEAVAYYNQLTGLEITSDSVGDADGDVTESAFAVYGFDMEYDTANGALKSIGGKDSKVVMNLNNVKSSMKAVTIDFSGSSNIANGGVATIEGKAGDEEGNKAGKKVGKMTSLSVDGNGYINASYDNGNSRVLGLIAIATFANASGLEKQGKNLYSASLNSGEASIGEIAGQGEKMTNGTLEMSNVDLSNEFTEMITTQRGFQANSRVITTSDSLLEELVNLKR